MTMLDPEIYTVHAAIEELAGIRAFVYQRLISEGIDSSDAHALCLAVDEACSNIILHGTHPSASCLSISVEFANEICLIYIKDNAKPFDPNSIESPDMKSYFKKYSYGGLGIELMRRIVDEMTYQHADAQYQWNILLLKKYLPRYSN